MPPVLWLLSGQHDASPEYMLTGAANAQLRAKKEAMESAMAAAAEDAGSMAAGEDCWDVSSQVSGASAVSGMSVYTAGQTGAPGSASAAASAYAPSTVGGRRPARQRKQKVRSLIWITSCSPAA